MASLTSSYLSSAARCFEALAASPACLRPLSQLQYTGEVLFHTPIPSATLLASLWRQLAIDMREYSTTQHNSTSPPPPLPETYRHCTPMSRQRLHQYEPQHCSMRPINQLTACTVSAAATQGHTLTQFRCPRTSACLTQTLFAAVNSAWEPQALTPASQPRLVTMVNTCKAATSIMP